MNSANGRRLSGGGVDKAIMMAGGPDLLGARKGLPLASGSTGRPLYCETGKATITSAARGKTFGKLQARHVCHAVGPQFPSAKLGKENPAAVKEAYELLSSAYTAALSLAASKKARTVAVPLISSSNFKGGQTVEAVVRAGVAAVWSSLAGFEFDCVYIAAADSKQRIVAGQAAAAVCCS